MAEMFALECPNKLKCLPQGFVTSFLIVIKMTGWQIALVMCLDAVMNKYNRWDKLVFEF